MRRILFHCGSLPVYSYPAMLYLGLVAGVAAGNMAAHDLGLDPFRTFLATLILIPPALLGARLLHLIEHWAFYRQHPERIWDQRDGGLAMYGGVPIMLVLSVPLLAYLRLDLGRFWDVASFTILVGMFFARIGCFLNGCCCGRPTDSRMGFNLPNHRGVVRLRIPVQCLEAAWSLVILLVSVKIRRSLPFTGALFCLVAGGYAAGRLVLEPLREEANRQARVTSSTLISIAILLLCGAFLAVGWLK